MKTLCVNIKGKPETVKVQAERIEENEYTNLLVAFDVEGRKVAQFDATEVAGHWYE